jgi:ABC-type nitrate/sulfonate/bicarbonate transport system permease component
VLTAAFASIGLPYWLLLGCFAGVLEIVPVIGPLAAGAAAVLVGLTIDWQHALLAAIAVFALRMLQDYLINPHVFGHAVGLSPLVVLVTVTSVGLLFGAWWWASSFYETYILPDPPSVWRSFSSAVDRGVWTEEVRATLVHMLIAFGIIIGAGLPLGIVIGRFWPVEDLTRVLLIFLQTAPTIVLIAIALILIGTNDTSVVAVTVASGITYFTLNVIQGTKAIDQDLVEMARAYNAHELRIMRSILLPSVVPYFLAAGRITLGVVWQVTLFSEYLMGTRGIGFQVSTAIKLLDTASVFQWGLSVVALTIAFEYGVFRPVEAFLTRHTRRG